MKKPIIYFTKKLSGKSLVELYDEYNKELKGNVAIKVHSGEKGNRNFIRPTFLAPIIEKVNGTIIESNTAYEGARNTTEKHLQLLKEHGWDRYNCDILDSEKDIILDIPNGKIIQKNYVGDHIKKYNSCLVISHVKGHPMGGFGGALKQLSIGFASSNGKVYIHGHGNFEIGKNNLQEVKSDNQNMFLESMADAASSIYNFFAPNILFINILRNISTSCDCDSNAPRPTIGDIGSLISNDPVAIDQCSLDLILNSRYDNDDDDMNEFLNVVNKLNGTKIIEASEKLGIGSRAYDLIQID